MSETVKAQELKPCPFCGSSDVKDDIYFRDGRATECRVCYASTYAYNPDARTKANDKWNRRATMRESL